MSIDLDDPELMKFLGQRLVATVEEFGADIADLPLPVRLLWGDDPEFRIAPTGSGSVIFLADGSDWWQVRYQLGHELFHLVCTPSPLFHWVHEMFAVHVALRTMDAIGQHDYVVRTRRRLTAQSEALSLEEMIGTSLAVPYPEGLYGRAYIVGRDLIAATGWEALKPLATMFDDEGRPDIDRWRSSLDPQQHPDVDAARGRA